MVVDLNELRNENEVIDIFCSLASIPSPSLKEEKVAEWILNFCKENNINAKKDDYGNIYIKVLPTDFSKDSLMLSAHMDVVGDDSPINIVLQEEFLKAENRTLGADDKAGVACALKLAKDIVNSDLAHGGLEIIFTRDEESSMSGVKHVDYEQINSKYILVCDADKLGQLQISGAGYTNAKLTVKTFKGGHSGIDIADKDRLNAAKLIAELIDKFPQGVFYADETGTITSCNLGAIVAGGVQNAVANLVDNHIKTNDYITAIMNDSATNIINTLAAATYSIRSASAEKEEELKAIMKDLVNEFNKKYQDLALAELEFSIHLLPFEKANNEKVENAYKEASLKIGINSEISSFHAGAETHIYCRNKNSQGEVLTPSLIGLADIYNMHSAMEKVDWKSLLKGSELIKNIFRIFNS